MSDALSDLQRLQHASTEIALRRARPNSVQREEDREKRNAEKRHA